VDDDFTGRVLSADRPTCRSSSRCDRPKRGPAMMVDGRFWLLILHGRMQPARSAGSRRRWTSGCASGSRRSEATRS